jgi:hypothetical protein
MPKVFYTERDIEDLAKQGVKSIEVNDDVVVTDAAREKARRVGVDLIVERPASAKPATSSQPAAAQMPAPSSVSAPSPAQPARESTGDLETRVYNSVKARLNGQVDDALLRTIVQRVLKSLGR